MVFPRISRCRGTFQREVHDPQQCLTIKRLRKKSSRPEIRWEVRRHVPGHEYDGQAGPCVANFHREINAVHPRHTDINENEVRLRRRVEQQQRRCSRSRFPYAIACLLEHSCRNGPHDHLIIHYQDGPTHRHCLRGLCVDHLAEDRNKCRSNRSSGSRENVTDG
jgi:hypothetical protein